MKFTDENIRYCLLTFDQPTTDHVASFAEDKLCISGLYLWSKVFKGDYGFPVFPEHTEKYNLYHLNITPRNIPLVPQILDLIDRNKTKLLFNVDHSIHMWAGTFTHTVQFLKTVDQADYVFAVEDTMAEILQDNLKRPVPIIPHPVNITTLEKLQTTQRDQRVGVFIHRYDNNKVLPWYAINELPSGWISTAIGAISSLDPNPKIHHLYPEVQPHLKFEDLMKFLATLYAVIESYTISSYGRATVECAALRVPVIGSDIVPAQKRLFPTLTIPNFNPVKAKKLLKDLINNPEFHKACTSHASRTCQAYSYENSKKRMLEFLNSNQ